MIRWFARNDIAANFLMIGIILAGLYTAFYNLPLEVRPARIWDSVVVSINYRGGSAEDVTRDYIEPTEEILKDLAGVESIYARAYRDGGRMYIRIEEGTDTNKLLEEVKSRVDQISSRFPNENDPPRVYIPDSSTYYEVLTVAITGKLTEEELRIAAERVRDDLISMPGISQANVEGTRKFEIAIEARQEQMRAYGLSFTEIADAIRSSSVNLPAGSISSSSGSLSIRTRGQAYSKQDFEKIPLRSADGADVLLGEVVQISDGFEEGKKLVRFNGEPALIVEVMRNGKESAIEISERVREYCDNAAAKFPDGINIYAWDDESISLRGRLSTLISSLVQGSVLVFILLGLFLRPMVAFWVVLGIPISFAGGVLLMPVFGVTANVMSLFGYIIVVGLVVDDAIVTGENIFAKMKTGLPPLEAAVIGTKEVAVPVTFGVLTTIVAFLPLLYFDGEMGSLANQVPFVVAPVLLFSLIESKLILPAHLKHLKTHRKKLNPVSKIQKSIADGLETFVKKFYQPSLGVALNHRYVVLACFAAMAFMMFGYCKGGHMGFVARPTVDRYKISADIDLPIDTPIVETDKYVQRISDATEQLKKEFVDPGTGKSLILNVFTLTGAGHLSYGSMDETEGRVTAEILPPSLRSEPGPRNSEIAKRWEELVGPIPEAKRFRIRGEESGGGRRDDEEIESLEIELRGKDSEKKREIAEAIEEHLKGYDGIASAWANVRSGQDELEIKLKPRAAELGISQRSLAQQVRQAFFGEEAQRVQRDRDEIRVMVRLPRKERRSLHTLETLKIRTPSGAEALLNSVADVSLVTAPSYIEREDGAAVIKISAQPQDEDVDIVGIAEDAAPFIQELVNGGNDLSFRYRGYIEEHEESQRRTLIGAIALLFALYALLAIPFKSLTQPIFVLLAVPFGIIGALLGHIILDITPSYLSIFGMLALAGVVVNDSLVMVDFINQRRNKGMPLREAVITAGAKRFRPILLTSITTFAGLMPLIFDRSIQAQFLIPMAVSLGFGILFATVITLYLIPASYLVSRDISHRLGNFKSWYLHPFRPTEPDPTAPTTTNRES